MSTRLVPLFMLMLTYFTASAQAPSGKQLFSGSCQACHSIGGGDVVGPDLAGVTERREIEWIKSFIRNSQKMIKEGDAQAVAVFNQYNKIAMPAHNFSDEELTSLISYIDETGQEAQAPAEAPTDVTADDPEDTGSQSGEEMPLWVKLIFGGLGLTIILLSSVAFYLIRLLRR